MKTLTFFCLTLLIFTNVGTAQTTVTEKQPDPIEAELNAYWAEVSRSVKEGDYAGYSATCHPLGILVSGNKKTSYPLSKALAKWKQGFEDTKAKKITASVEFRVSQRFHDATTAHETGIFRYATTTDGKETVAFIHFEGLLLKSKGRWQIMMENQKSVGTEAEWKALSPLTSPSSSTKRIKMFELISWLLTCWATVRLTTSLFVPNAVSRTTLSSFWLLADGLSVVCLPILMFSGHQLGVLKWLFLALFAIFYFLRFVLYVIGLRNSPGQSRVSDTNGTAD